jgi:hypothetical protein
MIIVVICGSFSFICFYASDVLVLHNVDPLVFQSVLLVRIGFNVDPDPALVNADTGSSGTVPCRSAEH